MAGALALGSAWLACSSPLTPPSPPVGTLEVRPSPVVLLLGQSEQLMSILLPDGGGVAATWTSANPRVATVTPTGVVTGVSLGDTVVTAQANGEEGETNVTVIAPAVDGGPDASDDAADADADADAATGCAAAASAPSWSGTLTLHFDTTVPSYNMHVAHDVDARFSLARDPVALPGQLQVAYLGAPTGTATMDESYAVAMGSSETNRGSGPLASIGNMVLSIDAAACTYRFEWTWGVAAVVTVNGTVASTPDPENAGGFHSAVHPLADFRHGVTLAVDFHAVGNAVVATEDDYVPVSTIGALLFSVGGVTSDRAPVAFAAKPDLPTP